MFMAHLWPIGALTFITRSCMLLEIDCDACRHKMANKDLKICQQCNFIDYIIFINWIMNVEYILIATFPHWNLTTTYSFKHGLCCCPPQDHRKFWIFLYHLSTSQKPFCSVVYKNFFLILLIGLLLLVC